MEPNKTYPLHPDHDDQHSTPSTPPVNSTESYSSIPSPVDGVSQKPTAADPDAVPWYLRPLTKTTQSPIASTQTQPYVPREPVLSSQQHQPTSSIEPQTANESTSPFRSQSLPPLRPPYTSAPRQQQFAYHQSAKQPQTPTDQQPLKPLSQFGIMGAPQPAAAGAPVKKPTKTRRLTGIVLAVLLIIGIGAGIYSLWQRVVPGNSPFTSFGTPASIAEESLYRAIDMHLQTRYVHQAYEQVTDGADGGVVKLTATSDFSDTANPKSYIRYDLTSSGSGGDAVNGAGEIMVMDKNEYFGKLSKPVLFYQGNEAAKPKENQWYRIADDDATGGTFVDPMSVRSVLNTPMGEFPVGSFNDTTRQELMQFIKQQNVYAIKGSNEVTEGNDKLTHYNVEVNVGLVNELNKRVADIIGINDDAAIIRFDENDIKNMEIWVSEDTGRIVKTKFNREYVAEGNAPSLRETVTTTIAYPGDGSAITRPEGVVSGPWLTR